jgi:hypothetical protein
MDTTAAAWSTSGVIAASTALSAAQNSALYGSRGTIFGGTTVTDGSTPYTSVAWTLLTNY